MAKTYPGRYAADIDGDFVVFLIGMRLTKPWRPTKWVPVSRAMQSMLMQLKADPEKACLELTATEDDVPVPVYETPAPPPDPD
jgi:hypothetical protein